MTREFKSTTVRTAPDIETDTLDVLAKAEQQFRGQVPTNPGEHAKAAQDWLSEKPAELRGPKGPEPTRFGDWERNGRCFDF